MAVTQETGRVTSANDNGIARYFGLAKYNVTIGSEVMAGVTTFLVMSYIAFVNPNILTSVTDSAGLKLDFEKTVTATCWVAAFLCLLMGVYARRPFAMAPGLGLNAFVAFTLVGAQKLTWGQAFGIIVLEGVIITILVLTKFRQAIMDAVPLDLKRAIAAGIGLFIL
jgi:AGZA family xanthine/uracil permease-like MFS transporter